MMFSSQESMQTGSDDAGRGRRGRKWKEDSTTAIPLLREALACKQQG